MKSLYLLNDQRLHMMVLRILPLRRHLWWGMLTISFIGFAACDPMSSVTFELENRSEDIVTVDYYDYDSTKVTHIVIPGQRSQILFQKHFIGYVDRYEQQDSVELDVSVKVWHDTTLLELNYNDKSTWQYARITKQTSWSKLIIE